MICYFRSLAIGSIVYHYTNMPGQRILSQDFNLLLSKTEPFPFLIICLLYYYWKHLKSSHKALIFLSGFLIADSRYDRQ